MRRITLVTVTLVCLAATAFADVKTEQKSQLKFEGALGRMMNIFGGRSMRDGTVSTVAIKGSRKMTTNGDTAQLIDLAEEKIYDINLKDKSYRVTTFAELIRQLQDARKKASEEAAKQPEKPKEPAKDAQTQEPQFDVDFDLKESGQKRVVNGLDAREVVMIVTVREKGKTLEQSGGFVTTSNMWLTAKMPGMEEMAEFERQYAQKLLGPALLDPQATATAAAMYPMLGPAMERMQKEKVNMSGTAVLTTTRFEAVADAATAKQQSEQKKEESAQATVPTTVAGLGGLLAGRLGRNSNKEGDKAATPPPPPTQPGRATVMTFPDEVLKVSQSVADADVSIPAGFKQNK